VEGCLACDLAEGRLPLPGGRIAATEHWLVDHTVGPLGVGTLIVRPKRHVVHVSELAEDEAVELGPFLRTVTRALAALLDPEQIYVTLWSHAEAEPGHIHWVVQPVTIATMDEFGGIYGPHLQVAMFDRNDPPPPVEVEAVCSRLRGWFADNAE
jgi:diadenosine tetraphosphate (Ap4A) HIT family hydrolase